MDVLLKEKEITDDEGIDLFMKMIVYNPQKRISASEALKHPYLGASLSEASLSEAPYLKHLYLKHPYLDET